MFRNGRENKGAIWFLLDFTRKKYDTGGIDAKDRR
jgi:hypothetical protein